VSGDGLVNAYAGTNSLIVIDSEDNIQRLVGILEAVDVPFSDREMVIIPVAHADASEIAKKLNEILGDPTGSKGAQQASGDSALDLLRTRLRENAAQAASTGNAPPAPSGAVAGGKTVGNRSREPKIIPDDRTNSIIVVADDDTTARIRALINQLDSKVDLSGRRFYVYRCQHAKADELSEVLSGLVGGEGGGSSSRSSGLGNSPLKAADLMIQASHALA